MPASAASTLKYFPPMGVYETLFKFLDVCHKYMGTPGTHPWAQGFPLTSQIPGGPELPGSVSFTSEDLKYPPATGIPQLRTAIKDYYNHFYDAGLSEDNVAVFAGGRPGIFATVAFLPDEFDFLIEETEYTPYYDLLELLDRKYHIVPSNEDNRFAPDLDTWRDTLQRTGQGRSRFIIKSNPCNPTGQTWRGDQLRDLVDFLLENEYGGLIDEAYEFFSEAGPESALKYISSIDDTNLFVSGAATKNLQVPGMRVGWVIASRPNIEIFRNYSSIGMGGVSRPAQLYVTSLLDIDRVTRARQAIVSFYNDQRDFYRQALADLDIELFTGSGGFYHWGKLPGEMNADEFNRKLFEHDAAILPGRLCDMFRRGEPATSNRFIRFSFGPLPPDSRDQDVSILQACLTKNA
jgi:aminotransferase